MKKIFASITIFLIIAVTGACLYAAGIRNVNERFGFYAEAEGGAEDGLERVFLSEITFNNLNLPDGSVIRALQVYVDIPKLCEGLEGIQYEARKLDVDAKLDSLKTALQAKNYTVGYEAGFLDITLEDFDSITDLYIANGKNGYENEQDETPVDWGVWYNTYTYRDTTIFSTAQGTLIEEIALVVDSIAGIAPSDIAFIYNYGTPYAERTIESDADKVYRYTKLDINIHKFVMDETTLDREYTIYQHAPNVVSWYLLAIVAVAIPAAAFTVYAYKKKKEADSGKQDYAREK